MQTACNRQERVETMGEKNKIKFKINGSEFLISAEEDKEYIVKISKMVDKRIQSLANESANLSTSMATVLAALNYCDELEKQKKITAELLRKNDALEAAAQKAKDDLQSFSVENEQLKEEKKGLHARIESLKAQLQQTKQRPQHPAQGHEKPSYQKNTGTQAAPKETPAQRAGQNPPKINYQENDKISEQYRREEFSDPATEDEMLSFFDNR